VSVQGPGRTLPVHNFSRSFVPQDTSSIGPAEMQQGLRTFLDASGSATVTKLNDTMVVIPRGIPDDTTVVAETIGMQLQCNLINPDCTFDHLSNATFDCSNVEPGAHGPIGAVNVTFYSGLNPTSVNLIAVMALTTSFNSSYALLVDNVFQCNGSLQNITYSSLNNVFNIQDSKPIDSSPLTTFWDLDAFPGKRQVIEMVLTAVGTSAVYVQGTNVSSIPSLFADGLSRLFIAFLSSEMISTPSFLVHSIFEIFLI
jgi:hypothetical protein